MIKEPHWKVHYIMRMPKIWSWLVQVTPKDLTIKYPTEGSACWIENVRLDRLKIGLNLDKVEDDIEEDREGRSKDKMDEKFPTAKIFLDLKLIKVHIQYINH